MLKLIFLRRVTGKKYGGGDFAGKILQEEACHFYTFEAEKKNNRACSFLLCIGGVK
ncbi:hypothetical protein [Bartonella queenslandensis]|uniref:hypothetical protein n=1 Tax=Bartonella queenslandensis TaxID=481138 RepID=UPI0003109643|nr:hypothetical protein [Bartonella queenslandensis]